MHDNVYNPDKLPTSFKNSFIIVKHNFDTRQTLNFARNKPRTNFAEKLVKHSFPIVWNKLDKKLKQTHNRREFKSKLTAHFLTDYMSETICNNPACIECHNR